VSAQPESNNTAVMKITNARVNTSSISIFLIPKSTLVGIDSAAVVSAKTDDPDRPPLSTITSFQLRGGSEMDKWGNKSMIKTTGLQWQ
jgi:hypothetical protein